MEDLIYKVEDLEKLSPEEKKEYIRRLILNVIQSCPEGITTTQIAKAIGIDIKTVHKHLEYLVAVREVYKKEFGKRIVLYFPNQNLTSPFQMKTYKIGGHYYTFRIIKNDFGEFIYIQERERNPYTNTYSALGGILIPKSHLDEFIEHLKKLKEVVS